MLNKLLYVWLIFWLYGCHSVTERNKQHASSADLSAEWLVEESVNVPGATIQMEARTVDQLLAQHHFENDSIMQMYKDALSKNWHFIMKVLPEHKSNNSLPVLDLLQMKSSSCLVMCEDTIYPSAIEELHDFGLSKSKQYLLVFPAGPVERNCDLELFVKGVFNKFDVFRFKIKEQ